MPAKFLGQHFLKNETIIQRVVAAIDVAAGDTIIEIGPGHGELTMPLVAACEKIGGSIKLIAIEKDHSFAAKLRTNFEALAVNKGIGFEIKEGDALKILPEVLGKNSGGAKIKLVGNIPYYLTGHLLRTVSELGPETKPERCIFMVQEEVAERITAQPPKMNRLAASVQCWAETKVIAWVPRSDFSPPPEVDSAVVKLVTKMADGSRRNAGENDYYTAMRTLFAQPRKTILNNLEKIDGVDKKNIAEALQSIGLNPNLRPQNLTIEAIEAIACAFWGKSVDKP